MIMSETPRTKIIDDIDDDEDLEYDHGASHHLTAEQLIRHAAHSEDIHAVKAALVGIGQALLAIDGHLLEITRTQDDMWRAEDMSGDMEDHDHE
jgi:hypothetical protein